MIKIDIVADRVKRLLLLALLIGGMPSHANSERYRGVGGQVEAYGAIVGFYLPGLKAAEQCGTYPSLRVKAKQVYETYLKTNKPVYDQATEQIGRLAEMNGGSKERERLNREMLEGYRLIEEELNKEIRSIAGSEKSCVQILANLKNEQWDLKVRAADKLQLLNVMIQEGIGQYPPALIKGILGSKLN